MPPKKMSEADKALWQSIIETVEPLPDRDLSASLKKKPGVRSGKVVKNKPGKPIGRKTAKSSVSSGAPSFSKSVTPHMDRKNFQRLLRGKFEIEMRLDLHGLTQDQARQILRSKILQAYDQGKRLVLVITGKGKTRKDEFNRAVHGVLRESLPQWVREPPLNAIVLETAQAQHHHGGAGAYYIYLRRKR